MLENLMSHNPLCILNRLPVYNNVISKNTHYSSLTALKKKNVNTSRSNQFYIKAPSLIFTTPFNREKT